MHFEKTPFRLRDLCRALLGAKLAVWMLVAASKTRQEMPGDHWTPIMIRFVALSWRSRLCMGTSLRIIMTACSD